MPDTRVGTGAEASLSRQLLRGLREGALLVFGMIALYLLVALVSYHPADPGWSYTGDGEGIRNLGGAAGAWFADVAFHLLGYLAFLIPLIFIGVGWWLFRHRKDARIASPLELSLRGSALLIALVSGSALAALHWLPGHLPVHAGGILGDLVAGTAAAGLGLVGATLLLFALFLTGFTLFTGLSWFALMDRLGKGVFDGIEWGRRRIDSIRDQRIGAAERAQREIRVERERARVAQRAPSRSEPRVEPRVQPPPPSPRVMKEKQVPLFTGERSDAHPPLALLDEPPAATTGYSGESLQSMSQLVELKLRDFGVEVEVVAVQPGPVITRFELHPAPGVKVARISALAKDLARSLSVIAVRIVEVIPGKSTVGLEIPNEQRELVSLSEILRSTLFENAKSPLTIALGKDIGGAPVIADLARMPHLLVAGTTGSGKSVGVNAMLISTLYKSTAEDVRLILIDPKMLELSVYEGIPHLLAPVVTDMKDASNALRWAVAEMERRYKLMSLLGVRNIAGYNKKVRDAEAAGTPIADPTFDPDQQVAETEPPVLGRMPFIVVVVDEFADMIMVVGKKVEELIARLAQKARAAGIHLILATQRPSVDVITGLIKANIPTRIAFQVSSRVDSRTILDQMGAEHLLGHGDMLYLAPGKALPERVHGAFVADHEVHKVVEYLKTTGEPDYEHSILEEPEAGAPAIPGLEAPQTDAEGDPLYDQAVQIVIESRKASISYVQRRLKIGYNRAARMVEDMEAAGLVSPVQSNGNREVLVPGKNE
ncbi:Cell division protein FtsK [Thioalkalivibrio nitratireducens DSM 14787]|uniref:DNA translocase FtsK n=1 Tax=Thioalkalivibrio nitratireducens (strain DSM 14787 / UNIQEM 213 / ALEN2) TaxID=1255043 RepID=L0E1R0_THIND|nr:DNA translocase FtsK [Thioalkalivibrio nitratireducens]AGA34566.1 Cell division protein FtsK [Thioalkalivibrio nitratireducens DSM 14787]